MLTKETACWICIIKYFILFGTNTKDLYENTALVKALINYNLLFIVTQKSFTHHHIGTFVYDSNHYLKHLVNVKITLANKIRK